MSLRITPPASHPKQTPSAPSAPSAPGVPDTLRTNLSLAVPAATASGQAAAPQSTHPLEARLTAWRSTQDALKMELLRRQFGTAEPVRRGMEMRGVREGEWRPALLGGSARVHSDILAGRDAEIDWEDVFGADMSREMPDFHTEMEQKLKMNW